MDVSSLKAAGEVSTFFDWIPHPRHVVEKFKPAAPRQKRSTLRVRLP
jgi:hypothetical protein